MDTNKLKPFNLEDALAGKPVVHGQFGRPVANVHVVGKRIAFTFADEGDDAAVYSVRMLPDADQSRSLFMAPVERTVWVNVFSDCVRGPNFVTGKYHDTEQNADLDLGPGGDGLRLGGKAHKLTISE